MSIVPQGPVGVTDGSRLAEVVLPSETLRPSPYFIPLVGSFRTHLKTGEMNIVTDNTEWTSPSSSAMATGMTYGGEYSTPLRGPAHNRRGDPSWQRSWKSGKHRDGMDQMHSTMGMENIFDSSEVHLKAAVAHGVVGVSDATWEQGDPSSIWNGFPSKVWERVPMGAREGVPEEAEELEEEEGEEEVDHHEFAEETERLRSELYDGFQTPDGTLIAPPHGTQSGVTGYCICPVCTYQEFVYFFFSSQRRASAHVLSSYPNCYSYTCSLPPLPQIADPGLGNICPIYRAWGFCPHSVGCYLQHDANYEAELHFLPRASRKDIRASLPWRRPRVKRGSSAQREVERLREKANLHLYVNEWTCDVCGFYPIREGDVQQVGETFFYRTCPYCQLSCCMPEVTYLLEHILWNAKDDYQLYKYLVDYYRTLLPDEFKVPFSFEAHQLATTVFAWSLVSPKDLKYAINAAYRVLPSLASVVSIGCGVGYVEHLLNRVMNNANLPAFGPVVAWRKSIEKAACRRFSRSHLEHASTCGSEKGETNSRYCGEPKSGHHYGSTCAMKSEGKVAVMGYASSISKEKACFYGEKVVPVFAFDELVRRYEYSVHVSLGGPLSVLSIDCENSVLLLCWPPFGSPSQEQSSMGYEALEYFHQHGGKVLIFIGDTCSTGDWRFHEMRDRNYKLVREYPVRHEVNRWYPQQMGLVYGGNDTIGVYERR